MNPNEDNNAPAILVVDDNPNNLQVLGGFLKQEGLKVEFAMDGVSALEWLENKPFDLILLDIMMPGMDGYEVCSLIKKNPSWSEIPVIFITAKTDSESIVKGFNSGGVDYITKPFIQNELMARVKSQVDIKKSKEKILLYLREIENRNRNIRESIEYARTIQTAFLAASTSELTGLPESFILSQPKDIVSGDFYWHYNLNDTVILAVMDCTGHGVPGAFMSILGASILNEIIINTHIVQPDEILIHLREKIIQSLGQNKGTMKVKDGIDGCVIRFDPEAATLEFSGTFNPLILIHNHEISDIAGDRIPIGYFETMKNFSLKTIKIEKGDIIYMYSDGFIDQFGGPENKKIMSKRFKELLLEHHNLPMSVQKEKLIDFLKQWIGVREQTDDILVVGIRF